MLRFPGGRRCFWRDIRDRKTSSYVVMKKVGRGKYSDCYRGLCLNNGRECCIKILKPVRMKKIKRYSMRKEVTA